MASALKIPMGISVLEAAQQRIAWTFDKFPKIYVSFSGGKDSTVMLHLVMEEAIRRGRKVGVLFVDLEGQYKLTIDHIEERFREYAKHIEPFWVCLPLHLRNAVSQFEAQWTCWNESREEDWIRPLPKAAINDPMFFPFFRHAMEFEEFVPAFGHWYGGGEECACFVGIRTDESLNRFRTIATSQKSCYDGIRWTTSVLAKLWNIYPIYDWRTEDIWTYHAKTKHPYNRLYDRMHQAGLTIHQARICQPYGDDQRKGLWLFHIIEPQTWSKIVARVNGANHGAIYAKESGNVLGRGKITKPDGHTWESFSRMLLESMPPKTRNHFEIKIDKFRSWWLAKGTHDRNFSVFPDAADPALEAAKKAPSWRRICKALLRYDYWCKGLSFCQPHVSNKVKDSRLYKQAKLLSDIEEANRIAGRRKNRK